MNTSERCPVCGHLIGSFDFSCVDRQRPVTVCTECTAILGWRSETTLEELTTEEVFRLPRELRALLTSIRDRIWAQSEGKGNVH